MSNFVEYEDTIVFHPGYYIEEILEKIPIDELSKKSGISEYKLLDLVKGDAGIGAKEACGLAKALGTTMTLWLNLQKAYDRAEFMEEKEYE